MKSGVRTGSGPPMSIEFPVRVLSDLHLAHPASYVREPEMVIPLLGEARTVIFNGDTCELLHLCRRAEALEKLRRLAAVCLDHGATPIFLTGNHDPQISTAHFLDLLDGKVFLTHGDVLDPRIAPWSHEAPSMWAERQRLLMGGPDPDSLEELHLLAKQCTLVASLYNRRARAGFLARLEMVGRFVRQPWRVPRVLIYWASVAGLSRRLLARYRPRARLMLIGHTHRAGVWPNRDFALVNTGSFQPLSRALVVHLEEGQAIVHTTRRGPGGYQLGREIYHRSL